MQKCRSAERRYVALLRRPGRDAALHDGRHERPAAVTFRPCENG
jgi:hypothetical protein